MMKMTVRKKRRMCAWISIGGFSLAYFACNGLERGFLSYGASVWMMVIGVLICILFGYKGGYLI